MKRWVKWLLLITLAAVVFVASRAWHDAHPFNLGVPLPMGKVHPQLLSGGSSAVLLAPDGTLWAWGEGTQFPNGRSEIPLRLGTESDWIEIAGSVDFLLARKTDGTLWVVGSRPTLADSRADQVAFAATRIGSDSDWTFIATTGFGGTFAIQKSGAVWAWGGFNNGSYVPQPTQFGSEPEPVAIAADIVSRYVLRRDGTIWSRLPRHGSGGRISMELAQIGTARDWAAISAYYDLLALKTNGTLWIGGAGGASFNAVAEGTKPVAGSLKQVGSDSDWSEVRAGHDCYLARKRDGSWWASGENLDGRLGFAPYGAHWGIHLEKLPFTFEPWALGLAGNTTLVFARDGSLWSWGKRLGAPPRSTGNKKFENLMNAWASRLPMRPKLFPDPNATWSHRPQKIWQWKRGEDAVR